MKRLLALALVAVAGLCLGSAARPATAPAPYLAALPAGVPFTVDAGPGDQSDPHVSGSLVSYTSQVNGGSAIDVYDIATGTRTEVPTNGGMDFLSDVSGSQVTFTHLTTQSEIGLYDTATGQSRIVSQVVPSNRRESRLGGSTLVWQDFDYTGDVRTPEITVEDLATDTVTRLTNDTLLDKDPAVSPDGNTVVWTKCRQDGTGCAVWEATRAGGGWQSTALTDTSAGPYPLPDSDGHVVVYTVGDGSDQDVYWQPVGGGEAHQLALPGQQINPNVSNGVITFEQLDLSTQVPNYDIYAYDIPTNTLYRVTATPQDETLNDVWVSPSRQLRIVWTAAESDYNVYGITVQLPSIPGSLTLSPASSAPSFTATVDDQSGRPLAGAAVRYTLGGAASGSGTCTTAADGTCSIGYTAPASSGTVTVSAFADTNGNGAQDDGEPGGTASRDFTAAQDGFSGFSGSIAGPPAVNTGHAGRTYTLRWQLTDASGTPITSLSAIASITYRSVACGAFTDTSSPAVVARSPGHSGLRYDTTAGQYVFNWSTPAAGCYTLTVTLDTGQALAAYFELT